MGKGDCREGDEEREEEKVGGMHLVDWVGMIVGLEMSVRCGMCVRDLKSVERKEEELGELRGLLSCLR